MKKFTKLKTKPVSIFLPQQQLFSMMTPEKCSTEFTWTDDELELLLKCCTDFHIQNKYQEINGKDKRNKYEK